MISRLPKENVLLLRHLLALMHVFQSNAQENHMTSLNLSVCISASMLWQPGPPSSPDGHGVHRVSTLNGYLYEKQSIGIFYFLLLGLQSVVKYDRGAEIAGVLCDPQCQLNMNKSKITTN